MHIDIQFASNPLISYMHECVHKLHACTSMSQVLGFKLFEDLEFMRSTACKTEAADILYSESDSQSSAVSVSQSLA